MKRSIHPPLLCSWILAAVCATLPGAVLAQTAPNWQSFHDYALGPLTSPNASSGMLRIVGQGATLRNFDTGEDMGVLITVENEGGAPNDFGARAGAPNAGSPADVLFGGKVDLSDGGLPGVGEAVKLTLLYSGLDPSKVYTFCGTVMRGGNYNNRWSVYSIVGANAFVAAHKDGSNNRNLFTAATFEAAVGFLEPNQVALNAGHNLEGSVVCWEKIEPAEDGTFRIEALRYMGPTPFGDAPNPGTTYSYGFEALHLAEFEATGNLRITDNPISRRVPAGTAASFSVAGTSPAPIEYQWQKAPAGTEDYSDIVGASAATYTTPTLSVADDGTQFRCRLTSDGNSTVSSSATISVDGTLPILEGAHGSVNFNAVHVQFSEAMNLDEMVVLDNYQISGGLTLSAATVLDFTTVRLLTSRQVSGAPYTLTVNNISDVAGNKIPANSKADFIAYSLLPNTVGVEVWRNITGGAVTDLKNDGRYVDGPDVDYVVDSMDSALAVPDGPLNTYGGRLRAWVTPDVTGEYEFFLAGDDTAELRMSLDGTFETIDSPENPPIATDATIGNGFQETGVDASTSVFIILEAGVSYALQAVWKESNGNDHCKVAWRLAGDPTPAAELPTIPGQYLTYYGPGGTTANVRGIALVDGRAVIDWVGSVLESSGDLLNWTIVTGAANPYSVTASGMRFYRAR